MKAARRKLRPEAEKNAFLLLGLDVMIDNHMELWLLECNAGPVIRRADYAMLKSLIDLVRLTLCMAFFSH